MRITIGSMACHSVKRRPYSATSWRGRLPIRIMRPTRGKYYERYQQGTNVVLLEPDLAEIRPQ